MRKWQQENKIMLNDLKRAGYEIDYDQDMTGKRLYSKLGNYISPRLPAKELHRFLSGMLAMVHLQEKRLVNKEALESDELKRFSNL